MLLLGQIIRLGLHLRDQVLAHDRDRHGPVRIEIDLDDARIDFGRRAVRLADDRDVARHHGAVLDRLELRRRDVAHDEALRRFGIERAQPRQIGLELARAADRPECSAPSKVSVPGRPSAESAMARLEAPHRRLDIGIVDVVLDRGRIEIARELQPLAQRQHGRIARAECAAGRSAAPAASRPLATICS